MGFIAAADPVSKQAYVFTDTGHLNDAIRGGGYIPLRPDNTTFRVQEFEGGFLLDGAPINVYIEGRWFEGQREALEPYWASGQVPTPAMAYLQVATEAMPEDVAANYENYQSGQSWFSGISPMMVVAGLAGAWLLLRK